MPQPSKLLFLPGAAGNTAFWQPMADLLGHPAARQILPYPGFGGHPADPRIGSLDDLAAQVVRHIDQPTALIAQSMGGILAIRAALEKPGLVTHLVLSVTSGGLDMQALGAADWRAAFGRAHPHLPDWFMTCHADLSGELGRLTQPTLLLWGDGDPYSPIDAGQRLLELIPDAELLVVAGGDHDLASLHARELAALVDEHLARPGPGITS